MSHRSHYPTQATGSWRNDRSRPPRRCSAFLAQAWVGDVQLDDQRVVRLPDQLSFEPNRMQRLARRALLFYERRQERETLGVIRIGGGGEDQEDFGAIL